MSGHDELVRFLDTANMNRPPWSLGLGNIPSHYKHLSVTPEDALRLAKLGAQKIGAYFGTKLFFSQALYAGAMLSGEFHYTGAITPSQYGKTYLLGMVLLIKAFEGKPEFIAGATKDITKVMMRHIATHLGNASEDMLDALLNPEDEVERLKTGMSKTGVGFANGGFIEPITLADTFADQRRSQAIGRGGEVTVDEAANVSDEAKAELGRRDFALLGDDRYQLNEISNPHQPGSFYDRFIADEAEDGEFLMWMDAVTALEEDRFTRKKILTSDFAKNRHTRKIYLLCELDENSDGMFETPMTYAGESGEYKSYFLGVDAATSGKDDIYVSVCSIDDDAMIRVEETIRIDTADWDIDVTPDEVIRKITRISRVYGAAQVCVDVAYGVWLTKGLRDNGVKAVDINFNSKPSPWRKTKDRHDYAATNASNKRAEMHLDVQGLIEDKGIMFHEDVYEQIKDTLPYITYKRTGSGGLVQIRKKNEIKVLLGHSPDAWDSVILAVHACISFMGGGEIYLTDE